MEERMNDILKTCIQKARNGELNISVFDLTYETGLAYPQLKDILDELVAQNELAAVDVKTYKFIGDINRTFDEATEEEDDELDEERMQRIRDIIHSQSNDEEEEDDEEERRAYLERRRQEILARMQENSLAEDSDDEEEEDEEEETDDNDDEEEDDGGAYGTENIFVPDDEEKLRYNALKVGIRNGVLSVPFLRHTFPFIGYARANKLMDWLKEKGFVKSIGGSVFSPCRVVVTMEEVDRIFHKKMSAASILLEKTSRKNAIRNLAAVLSRIAQKKQAEVTADKVPSSSLWNYKEFDDAVLDRLERLIRSDLKMARRGAIKKAETYLEAVRDTRDGKMLQVYERLVYELKVVSDRTYNEIRKRMREGG